MGLDRVVLAGFGVDLGDVAMNGWQKPTSKPGSEDRPAGLPPRPLPPQSFDIPAIGLFGFTPAGSTRPRKVWRVDDEGVVWAGSSINGLHKLTSEQVERNARTALELHERQEALERERARSEDRGWPAVVRSAYLSRVGENFDPITAEQFARMMDVAYEGERPDDDRLPRVLPEPIHPLSPRCVSDSCLTAEPSLMSHRQWAIGLLTMMVMIASLVVAMLVALS